MKKLTASLLLVVVVATLSVSCKKIITNLFDGFDANVPEIVVNIPAIQPPVPGFPVPNIEVPVGTFTQRFDLDSAIKDRTNGSFGAGDVNSVKIKKIAFSIANADQNNNLANFESARLEVSSNTNTTPVQIASFNFPDTFANAQVFEADAATTPQLVDYLKGGELTYRVFGKLRRYTDKPLTLSVITTLSVK